MEKVRRDLLPERVFLLAAWGVVVATLVATLAWFPPDDFSGQCCCILLTAAFGDEIQPLRFFAWIASSQNSHPLLDGISPACFSRAPPV
jgi:hypothetical protein